MQLGNLQLVRHTAHHVGNAQATAMANQVNRVVGNLLSQFTGWANDQSARGGCFEVACAGRVFALGALWRRFTFSRSISHQTIPFSTGFSFSISLLLEQGMQHRQQEGGGFAAASLARDHQIDKALGFTIRAFARQSLGDGGQLHAGGLGETQLSNSSQQFRRQAQQLKTIRLSRCGYSVVSLGHFSISRCRSQIVLIGKIGGIVVRYGISNKIFRRKVARYVKSVGHKTLTRRCRT